ncbi:MAG: hypothetical protein Q8O13_04950 [Candidatus Omnitrophota bacterium]|nr:hypothetical protein [Candidatus Omnitrophota bacterium]
MANKIISILKLIFAVLLLPIVIAISFSFYSQLNILENLTVSYFTWGIFSFLILYHLIWEPEIIFKKGQRIVEIIFKFFTPLVKIASFCLPIYTLLTLIIYLLLSLLTAELKNFVNYFIFFVSFFLTMHIVFAAKSLKSRESDFLKANYFFAMELIYIVNLSIIAGAFNLIFWDFSFLDFFRLSCQNTQNIFLPIFNQLF